METTIKNIVAFQREAPSQSADNRELTRPRAFT